jgi:hypothetical protein
MVHLLAVMIRCVGVEQIERAFDLCQGFLADMQVDHGGELVAILHLLIT